jgi:hypothetical protein
MAKQEHLAKLEEGVEAWNAWRLKNLDIVPDLNGADFSGANFQLTRNLSFGQLSEVKTLYEPQLDPDLMKQIERNYPHLLAKPESDK